MRAGDGPAAGGLGARVPVFGTRVASDGPTRGCVGRGLGDSSRIVRTGRCDNAPSPLVWTVAVRGRKLESCGTLDGPLRARAASPDRSPGRAVKRGPGGADAVWHVGQSEGLALGRAEMDLASEAHGCSMGWRVECSSRHVKDAPSPRASMLMAACSRHVVVVGAVRCTPWSEAGGESRLAPRLGGGVGRVECLSRHVVDAPVPRSTTVMAAAFEAPGGANVECA